MQDNHKHKKPHEVDLARPEEMRKTAEYGTGFSDNLTPVTPLDLSKVNSVYDLVKEMEHTAFGGRAVGEAAETLYTMVSDGECFRVGTFSGAMTVGKMGLVICDMIDDGMINAVVTTGALMAHGFVEAAGLTHFKYNPEMDDTELYEKGYNRVYDTLELEQNLDDVEEIFSKTLETFKEGEQLSSCKITNALGKYLHDNVKGRGILKSAYEKNVPIYIPAFTDSELGLDYGIYRRKKLLKGETPLVFDPFLDLEDYTKRVIESKKLGIFTIGGGVPRNWAQQVGPYLDIIQSRIGEGGAFKRFHYGLRICPEPAHWGGLSGCTYSEGVSWGKFVPVEEGGMQTEVLSDATLVWPMIVKAVQERIRMEKQAAKPKE